jgi:D-alanyl-D-alanine dipeptidase
MKEARATQPPSEDGEFRKSDLVELTKLDPTIRLEIRYATTNNFLGTIKVGAGILSALAERRPSKRPDDLYGNGNAAGAIAKLLIG